MIKGIVAAGQYTMVSNGNSSTYVNAYGGAQGVGNVRFNTTNQNLEVFDGSSWVMLNMSFASVGLTGEAESLLDWAREERAARQKAENMALTNVTVADALNRVREAEQQLIVIAALCEQQENNQ
jgi:hypothetical protein